jgi:protein-arginine kinase activator protein McsA
MKICPNCQETTHSVSVIEIKCNGKLIHGIELCPKCRDNFLNKIPLYTPKVQDVLPTSVEDCQLPIGTKIVTQEQLWDILQGKIDPADIPDPNQEEVYKPCPNCGLTAQDLYVTNKFGCPTCYNHFEDLVIEFAEQVHGSQKHVGKRPKGQTEKEEKIKLLKMQLVRAKEHSDFQQAASIVNQLKELE